MTTGKYYYASSVK